MTEAKMMERCQEMMEQKRLLSATMPTSNA